MLKVLSLLALGLWFLPHSAIAAPEPAPASLGVGADDASESRTPDLPEHTSASLRSNSRSTTPDSPEPVQAELVNPGLLQSGLIHQQPDAPVGSSDSTAAHQLASAPLEALNTGGTPIALPDTIPDSDSLIRVLPRFDLIRPQTVRPLPGQLDSIPVFNSNSPELIQKEGILLSTFPGDGMQMRDAHLNYPMQGRFDVFAHHIAKGINADDVRTLYLGIVVYNPAEQAVKLDILQGVTYLSQEAPFNNLPAYVANPLGTVFSGPGSRVTNDVLRGERQPQWPNQVTIPAKSAQLLVNVPIPLRRLTVATNGTLPPGAIIPGLPQSLASTQTSSVLGAMVASTRNATLENPLASVALPPVVLAPPAPGDDRPLPINGRSILMRLSSSGPVYLASLAMYAPRATTGDERVPSLSEWIQLLRTGGLAGPRDRPPTSPTTRFVPRFYYGRVAGVASGSQWTGRATDKPEVNYLSIPEAGEALSYVISSVDRNTFGTGQIQSAPMLVRYPDTAYRAHGNYGILYNITLPLRNNTDSTQRVAIMLQTPLQDEDLKGQGLAFRNPPYDQIFFRGTVRLRYTDDLGIRQTRYMHVVQRRGQAGEPLIRLTLPKGQQRPVEVQLIYPPDATPPQVLTVETQPYNGLAAVPGSDSAATAAETPAAANPAN
ncbi:MAG: DUF3370 domain-containing protein [Elainella sp.]